MRSRVGMIVAPWPGSGGSAKASEGGSVTRPYCTQSSISEPDESCRSCFERAKISHVRSLDLASCEGLTCSESKDVDGTEARTRRTPTNTALSIEYAEDHCCQSADRRAHVAAIPNPTITGSAGPSIMLGPEVNVVQTAERNTSSRLIFTLVSDVSRCW
jgi:hypothetical protein